MRHLNQTVIEVVLAFGLTWLLILVVEHFQLTQAIAYAAIVK